MTYDRSIRTHLIVIAGLCAALPVAVSCRRAAPKVGIDHPAIVPALATVTQRYDNARSSVTPYESTLTPAVVASEFGMVASSPVLDGSAVYAQPLFVPALRIAQGMGDFLFVATNANNVFALDANTLQVRLKQSLGAFYQGIAGHPVGIVSTPVIDRTAGKIYVVAQNASGNFTLFVLALNNLAILASTPITANASDGSPFIGANHYNRAGLLLQNGQVYAAFGANPLAGNESTLDYHGWIIGYDATTLAQTSVYCTSPKTGLNPASSGKSGIWQSGSGLSADALGLYFMSGNGQVDATHFGDSINRIPYAGSSLTTSASFAPPRGQRVGDILDLFDLDLGSSAPLLVGNNLIVGGGKEGILYLLDRTTTPFTLLQSFRATYNQFDHTYCEPAIPSCGSAARPGPGVTNLPPSAFGVTTDGGVPTAVTSCTQFQGTTAKNDNSANQITYNYPHIHNEPVYFAGSGLVYLWAERDTLRAFSLDTTENLFSGTGPANELFCANTTFGSPAYNAGDDGGFLSISWNGSDPQTAVLWAYSNDAPTADWTCAHAVLHAYRAFPDGSGNLPELWNSDNLAADNLPKNGCTSMIGHFAVPTVANGRVYIAGNGEYSQSRIYAYGVKAPTGPHFAAGPQWLTGWGQPDWAGSGDFDGDGKSDIAWYTASNNTLAVARSTGSGYEGAVWLTGWGKPDWAGVGDFNHDGYADIAWYTAANTRMAVALSTGPKHGFTGAVWLTGWGMPDWAGVGDFDGDGRPDIAWYTAANTHMAVMHSTGSAFTGSLWLTGWGKPDWAGVGDFDGDGKADIAWYEQWNNNGVSIARSTGTSFTSAGQWLTGWGKPDWAGVGDFNGDGKADLAWYEAWNSGAVSVAASDGARLDSLGYWLVDWGRPDWAGVGDFNGDHKSDIAWYEQWKNDGITVGIATN